MKLINKIGLGNLILLMWGLILPTIAIGITCYVKGWCFDTSVSTPKWFSFIAKIYIIVYILIVTRYVLYNVVGVIIVFIIIIIGNLEDFIKKMNKTKLCIITLIVGLPMLSQAQICKDYACVYQGKRYTVNIGVFSPNDDGRIVIKIEKPNKQVSLKSYDFHSYEPLGCLFIEQGNTKRRVLIEKDIRNIKITAITFISTEEKVIYKLVTK